MMLRIHLIDSKHEIVRLVPEEQLSPECVWAVVLEMLTILERRRRTT